MTLHDLLTLSNQEIAKIFINQNVKINSINGEIIRFRVKSLSLASNPPYLFVGFIKDDNSHFGMENIESIIVEKYEK